MRVRERLGEMRTAAAQQPSAQVEYADHLLARVGDRDVVIPIADVEHIAASGVYAAVNGWRPALSGPQLPRCTRTLVAADGIRSRASVPDRVVRPHRDGSAQRERDSS